MTDQVTKETDQRLDEAAEILDKVVRDMEDLTPVGDALLSAKQGLGDASRSISGLADQASDAMEQWKVALAVFETATKTLQSVPVETREAIDAASSRVEETVGRLRAELAEARESSAESARRLHESVESSSRETVARVGEVAALVERTGDVLGETLRSVPVETREAIDAASSRIEETVGCLRAELAEARESSAESARRLHESVESSSRETAAKVGEVAALVERTRDVLGADLKRLRTLLWVGCGIGAVVVALMVVRALGP